VSDAAFLLAVTAVTSLVAYFVARRWLGRASGSLGAAVRRLLECAGLVAVFYFLNFCAGFAAVSVLRRLSGGFISAYVIGDGTLVLLSALQAIVLQWWRAEG